MRNYGIELELDGADRITDSQRVELLLSLKELSRDWQLFFLKRDGSLDYSGIELVTHPVTIEAHRHLVIPWVDILEEYKRAGYRETNASGIHIATGVRGPLIDRRYALIVNRCKLLSKKIARRETNFAQYVSDISPGPFKMRGKGIADTLVYAADAVYHS